VGFKTGRRIWQRFAAGNHSYLLLAVYLAWLSYLIQGLFNDSTVGTATLYWFFLGVLVVSMGATPFEKGFSGANGE
jgi:hypothetical protein